MIKKLLDANARRRKIGKTRATLTEGVYSLPHIRSEFEMGGLAQTHFVPAASFHQPASMSILRGKYYEPSTHPLIEKLLARRPGDLIHAGTYFGDMLPSFSAKCPGRIYAFEPVLESYICARLCLETNGIENVVLFNAGLSSGLGLARIRTIAPTGKSIGGGARIVEGEGVLISTVTVDSLGLTDLSVLQLDLEGHESPALDGAAETIRRCKPVILLEDHSRRSAPQMEAFGYIHVGELPAQNIWALPEDAEAIAAIHAEVAAMRPKAEKTP